MSAGSLTRFAPTPSGYLHIGNACSFLITAQTAKERNAQILLRIDDLDQPRVKPAFIQDIFDTLHFLGLKWDLGPRDPDEHRQSFSQVHRMNIYQKLLDQLSGGGHVFACICSRSETASNHNRCVHRCREKKLPLETADAAWRLDTQVPVMLRMNTPENVVKATLPAGMNDFIIRKKDGFPAYQLTSLADDMHFGVDLIVRGEDLHDSTLAQLYLANVLGIEKFQNATFVHHPLVTRNGIKLSKSAGDTSIRSLRANNATREDVIALCEKRVV